MKSVLLFSAVASLLPFVPLQAEEAPRNSEAGDVARLLPQDLEVHEDGSVTFEGKVLTLSEFKVRCKTWASGKKDPELQIFVKPVTKSRQVMEVMTACAEAGVDRIRFITKDERAKDVSLDQPVLIAIEADGALLMAGKKTTRAECEAKFKECAATPEPPTIHIQASHQATYAHVRELLELCQKAGLSKVKFVTEAEAANAK